jgi:restriction endonuclease Mrr
LVTELRAQLRPPGKGQIHGRTRFPDVDAAGADQFADGKERRSSDIRAPLAVEFGLSQDEQQQRVPNGPQSFFGNRIAWALGYLRQARILESPRRGIYVITQRGRDVLQTPPEHIDMAFLERYPDCQTLKNGVSATVESALTKTPKAKRHAIRVADSNVTPR